MKLLKEVTNDTAHLQFIEHNGLKFKLEYDPQNYCAVAGTRSFYAAILKDGVWVKIAHSNDIGFKSISGLFTDAQRKADAAKFFQLMKEHIEMLY